MDKAGTSATNCKDGDDNVVSMVDVLDEEKQYEADANAVLGGSDPSQCTYEQGYISRQALYACSTCVKPDMDKAGICLACSLECHDGHDLYELYTKRNFRCDCGNGKFPKKKCKFSTKRDEVNEKNTYNQNFSGKYCTCERPYPDPDDDIEDEMLQCVVCEDWYHGRHTGCDSVPEDYEEFICQTCCDKYKFLYDYATLFPKQNGSASGDANDSKENAKEAPKQEEIEVVAGTSKDYCETNLRRSPRLSPKKSPPKSPKKRRASGSVIECLWEPLKKNAPTDRKSSGLFWPEGWRETLCVCDSCKKMYEDSGVSYLCDSDDTVREYEARGRAAIGSYEKGLKALQSIGRTQQVEVLSEYATMKSHLTDYLKKFADSGKVVRQEDIKEFFDGLKASKRQRTGLQYFCR